MVRRERNSDLCGFEGAKPRAASEAKAEQKILSEEVGRPFDGRTDGIRKRGSRRQEPRSFPVTIA